MINFRDKSLLYNRDKLKLVKKYNVTLNIIEKIFEHISKIF